MKPSHEPPVLEHEYDGIHEYDNPTPGWWHAIFLTTVAFCVLYAVFWHASPLAWSVEDAWDSQQLVEYKRIFSTVGELQPDEATILRVATDQKLQSVAKGIFLGSCAACHGRDGGGINGVNLTDDSYKNIRSVADIYRIISDGANLGAMPSWRQRLSVNERVILAAYVMNLRGKNVPGRGAEGDVIPPFPPAAPGAPSSPQ